MDGCVGIGASCIDRDWISIGCPCNAERAPTVEDHSSLDGPDPIGSCQIEYGSLDEIEICGADGFHEVASGKGQ